MLNSKTEAMSKKTVKQVAPFLILLGVAIAAIFVNPAASFDPSTVLAEDGKTPKYVYNSGDIAWMLVSCAFVFLMTPATDGSSKAEAKLNDNPKHGYDPGRYRAFDHGG